MPRTKHISVLIPCHNEEKGIAAVLDAFPRERIAAHGYALDIIVIDNVSTDKTAEVARARGARVVYEPQKGKGNAMRRAFREVPPHADYVVMLDGDATYEPREMLRLIELLDAGFCDAVLGSRLGGRIAHDAMTLFNRAGNWVFSHVVRYFYGINVTDVLTGYFAWRADALARLREHLHADGFAIEMEMVTKMARLGFDVYCVPITYCPREGGSHLRPVHDGVRILRECARNLFWRPPAAHPRIAVPAAGVLGVTASVGMTETI